LVNCLHAHALMQQNPGAGQGSQRLVAAAAGCLYRMGNATPSPTGYNSHSTDKAAVPQCVAVTWPCEQWEVLLVSIVPTTCCCPMPHMGMHTAYCGPCHKAWTPNSRNRKPPTTCTAAAGTAGVDTRLGYAHLLCIYVPRDKKPVTATNETDRERGVDKA
jgi:hypothetical protein